MAISERDVITPATEWLREVISDKRKRASLRRETSLQDFRSSWYVASLLGQLHVPKNDQLLTSLWGAATAKEVCDGSLAQLARKYGVNERRWRKLTSTRDRTEAARQVRRIVRQLPQTPIKDVIEHLFFWGPTARRRWAVSWFDVEEEANDEA